MLRREQKTLTKYRAIPKNDAVKFLAVLNSHAMSGE
jgi:hypothetical protein